MARYIREIPVGSCLESIGSFEKSLLSPSEWRVPYFFHNHTQGIYLRPDTLCHLKFGHCFFRDGSSEVADSRSVFDGLFPPLHEWERIIHKEDSWSESQVCFLFRSSAGVLITLPAVVLTKALFMMNSKLTQFLFQERALDYYFLVDRPSSEKAEIHVLPDLGVPAYFVQRPHIREFLAWVLLREDLRDSFHSVYKSISRSSLRAETGLKWRFSFDPPEGVHDMSFSAIGSYSSDGQQFLVDHITGLLDENSSMGLKEVQFFHTQLKETEASGKKAPKTTSTMSAAFERDDEVITAVEKPSSIAKNFIRSSGIGRLSIAQKPQTKVTILEKQRRAVLFEIESSDSEKLPPLLSAGPQDESGSCQAIEFSGPSVDDFGEGAYISDEFSGIHSLMLTLSNLPEVVVNDVSGSFSLREFERYKLSKKLGGRGFREFYWASVLLTSGVRKDLIEVDTSDLGFGLSTRVFNFHGKDSKVAISDILRETLARYLHWPTAFIDHEGYDFVNVYHPSFSGEAGKDRERLLNWQERIRDAVLL